MFRNYFRIGLRNLLRHKSYTFINILGLAVGIATSLLILVFVNHEVNYDRFHREAERIYRVCVRGRLSGSDLNQAITSQPMAAALREDYPEVENVVRLREYGNWMITYKDKKYHEENVLFADSTFFEFFDFRLIQGDPATALDEPRSMVVSESIARKYFGEEDPIGKMIKLERDTVLTRITGVMEDVPGNSHIHFDMVGALHTYALPRHEFWLSHNFYTYILLRGGADADHLESRLNEMVNKYVGPAIEGLLGVTLEDMEKQGSFFGYYLQPLLSIHLNSDIQYEFEPNGNKTLVYIFMVVALLILVVACINFMNLATARSSTRAREVGIRKLVGAHRPMIIIQFLVESLFLVTLSFLAALLLVRFLMPYFANMVQIRLNLDFLYQPGIIPVLAGLLIVTGLFAGSYPAFFLASFRPVSVLKGTLKRGSRSSLLRSILVVLQMGVSIFILVGAVVTFGQLRYMIRKDPGFDRENVMVIKRSDVLRRNIESFKQEILKNPNVLAVSHSNSIPGRTFSNNGILVEGRGMENTYLTWQSWISYDFEKVFSFELADGRFFSRDFPTDSNACVINEAAVKSLELEEPVVGKRLLTPGGPDNWRPVTIIGVLKDFHFKSMHHQIEPMSFMFIPGNWEGYIPVRLAGKDVNTTIQFISETWESFTAEYPFDYFWMDDDFARHYETERRTSKVFIAFTLITILIACLGLIGLVSYTAVQRTREIGIRKAMGSSAGSVVLLFARETGKLVFISALVAAPIWFAIQAWLRNFAFHISFNMFIFIGLLLVATLVILLLAWFSVGSIAVQSGRNNPADSLRHE